MIVTFLPSLSQRSFSVSQYLGNIGRTEFGAGYNSTEPDGECSITAPCQSRIFSVPCPGTTLYKSKQIAGSEVSSLRKSIVQIIRDRGFLWQYLQNNASNYASVLKDIGCGVPREWSSPPQPEEVLTSIGKTIGEGKFQLITCLL